MMITGVVLLAALWLDLSNRGMMWDVLWNVTGETEPAAQLLGATQYAATYTRVAPQTAGNVEIQYLPENPFGVNTFLEQEVFPEKRERQLQMISDAGFGWIRQEFPWEDIEIHGRGDFMDRRNMDAVGEISAWDKYDNIVDLATQYDIDMIARLSNPPAWSQPPNWTRLGPPADIQDYVNFAATVAERYQGRIKYYQIWNEPNIYPEWGTGSVDPAGYADMLCRTYDAIKAVDPESVVLMAALAPTIELSGRDAYDFLYLQRLYDYGVSDCFDVLSAQAYGLFSGPTDRRMRTVLANFARPQWLRDIMINNGDAHKPIWISEAGWNPVPADPTGIADYDRFGVVNMEQAAEFVPLAYQRALSEWEWLGMISYWFFKRANDAEINQSWYYFRLVNPDFTPTPIYDSFATMIQSGEWQQWRDTETYSWERHARARVPIILGGAWAIALSVFVMVRGYVNRR